ncbi:hypothetical protein TVAG_115480 [Trichomonas vaginalis G3]|uniref:Sel1 repeat family protein n=1 Tax=Trichomonas vaginalis (strain ATCC PRA-98 / G3) TaxID=412133 RepID=A2F7I6_TRIV3|nr:activator of C kinase protein 1-related family [Trichomonas vaginalis G3]EAX99144.1 hypothetical protein TVAG_115480 [Trichomonas vaginalis G3]KAI5549184.1 activator of C kinase protein 1-related family [Trichomonas vaginalis G3]|eukprot:XP_001312074.1 hypothetical protein [Trichomonas vaginalis G3]
MNSLFMLGVAIPQSKSVWKFTYMMDKSNYLPPPPVFKIIEQNSTSYFVDALTYPENETNPMNSLYHTLRSGLDINETIQKIENLCENGNSQACLGYGRIYEFGAFGTQEDHSIAQKYYLKADKLGNNAAKSLLSFYHRTYEPLEIPKSVVESNLSWDYLESILPITNQYLEGKYRPYSCPSAYKTISRAADIIPTMFIFPIHRNIPNSTELDRLSKSKDPIDMYNYAMSKIFIPYPTEQKVKNAIKLLNNSFNNGYKPAIGPITTLLKYQNSTKLFNQYLNIGVKMGDPTSLLLKAGVLLGHTQPPCVEILSYLRQATNQNYAPGFFELGLMSYYGLCGVGRSNVNGYMYFSQSASKGHFPSMLKVSQQLIGGDGAVANCDRSVEMLRQLIDYGPWVRFFDKYVQRGSEHAFRKMLDLGLTPSKNFLSSNSKDSRDANQFSYVRNARSGNATAALWLAMNSPLHEAEEYFYRMSQMQLAAQSIVGPVKFYVMMRELPKYIKETMPEEDSKILVEYIKPLGGLLIEFILFITLIILISVRVKTILQ